MFLAIFKFEIKYWLKQPTVYVFIIIFLLLGMSIMAGYAGMFDEAISFAGIPKLANSPINIHKILTVFKELMLIVLSIIIGQTIYRDFDSGIYTVFYSYPFEKSSFFLAKFFSAFLVVVSISFFLGIGTLIGTLLPGVNTSLLAPFSILPYLLEYAVYIIPNALFYGMIVFTVVALSRNIYAGFIAAIGLVVMQQILGRVFISMDNLTLFSLFDPFGNSAVQYYTRTWTVIEQNTLLVPFYGLVLYNRLIWFSMSLVIFLVGYSKFSFTQGVSLFTLVRGKVVKVIKNDFVGITKIDLPMVHLDFSILAELKASWRLSNTDFKYILRSGPFIVILIIGFILVLITLSQMNPQYANKLLPVTWLMLLFPLFFFLMVVNLLTFLYAGMLIDRSKSAKMNQLLDASPVSSWVLVLSKFFALVKMQMMLLALVAVAGILVQTFAGYFQYELGLYIFHLFVLNLIGCVIWACFAILVQTIFINPYLGLFILVIGVAGIGQLQKLGIESILLRYNQNPDANFLISYSDMGGYGAGLIPFLVYKFYWLLAGFILLFGSFLLWVRGVTLSLKERLFMAKTRINKSSLAVLGVLLVVFLSCGFIIHFYENQEVTNKRSINKSQKTLDYNNLSLIAHPRITDVKLKMDIYPKSRDFVVTGTYSLINNTKSNLDTIVVSLNAEVKSTFELNKPYELLYSDTEKQMHIVLLKEELSPNDSLILTFEVRNIRNTLFKKNSPIEANGTFLTSHMFAPKLGYQPEEFKIAEATDSAALQNMYRSVDADFINFEAIVGTSKDQIAIAPGYLENEWTENNRNYFQYKSDNKVTNDYVFNSGTYDVSSSNWEDPATGQEVVLEIYHHPLHTYNLERMMNGLKAGLDYNSKYFAPYQHKQARIIEYSRSSGNYGQSYANTLPLSEVSFVADIDTKSAGSLDKLFGGIAHEIAHQWWGHQAIPAGVTGYAMITESMSEYVALKVIENEYGVEMLRTYTKVSMEKYLKEHNGKSDQEHPLIYNKGQEEAHVPYEKGSLAMYALSDYLGEDNFNRIIKEYLHQVRFKSAPYTTSYQMVDFIKKRTPDSLKYLVYDLFETVTLYDNKIINAVSNKIAPDKFEVEIEFDISKFRSGEGGKRIFTDDLNQTENVLASLPLNDYIELVIFIKGLNGREEAYRQKHLINKISNKLTITVNKKPTEVAVDPYYKLIDANLKDNSLIIQ